MRKVLVFIIFVFVTVSVIAQVSIFSSYDKENKFSPAVTIFGQKRINENFSFTYFGLVSEHWAEAQFGLAYSPNTWSQIGIMAGFEQGPDLFRTGAFIWLGNEKFSSLTLLERGIGEDNYWYRVKGLYRPNRKTLVGLQAWRYKGLGPLIEYRLDYLDSIIWIFPSHDLEYNTSMLTIGIDIKI